MGRIAGCESRRGEKDTSRGGKYASESADMLRRDYFGAVRRGGELSCEVLRATWQSAETSEEAARASEAVRKSPLLRRKRQPRGGSYAKARGIMARVVKETKLLLDKEPLARCGIGAPVWGCGGEHASAERSRQLVRGYCEYLRE